MNRPRRRHPGVHASGVLEQLTAIERAYSEPQRLVQIVSGAADEAEALAGIRREFGLSDELACTVSDQQLLTFTGERLTRLRAEIAALISGEAPSQAPQTSGAELTDWIEIVLGGLAPGESRIGWSSTADGSHLPMFDAAIRELTSMRDRLAAEDMRANQRLEARSDPA